MLAAPCQHSTGHHHRKRLITALGPIEEAVLANTVQQARTLSNFAQRRGGSGGGSGWQQSSSSGVTPQPQPPPAPSGAEVPKPFGDELDFRPQTRFASADEAVLAMCEASPGGTAPGQPRHAEPAESGMQYSSAGM